MASMPSLGPTRSSFRPGQQSAANPGGTRALARGTWELSITVPGDTTTYVISFDLR